jgi:hypothetical protein
MSFLPSKDLFWQSFAASIKVICPHLSQHCTSDRAHYLRKESKKGILELPVSILEVQEAF